MTTTHPAFAFKVGDDWTIDATLHDVDGSVLDLTGASVSWELQNRSGQVLITLDLDGGITFGVAQGTVQILLQAVRTAGIVPGTYYDLVRVVLANGRTSVQAEGAIIATHAGAPLAEAPPTSGFTMDDWTAINAAIATGARSVRIGDRSVDYNSLDQLRQVREMIGTELGLLTPRQPSIIRVAHNDGHGPARRRY